MAGERIIGRILKEVYATEGVSVVAAVFPYSLTTPESIIERTDALVSSDGPTSLDLVDVLLAQKFDKDPETGLPSAGPNMLSYVGGSITGEKLPYEAVKAVSDDVSLAIVPLLPEEMEESLVRACAGASYEYKVVYPGTGGNGPDRVRTLRAFQYPMLVLHPKTLSVVYPRQNIRKVRGVIPLPCSDFQHAVETGEYNGIKLIGSLVAGESTDENFVISSEENVWRNAILARNVEFLDRQNSSLKERFKVLLVETTGSAFSTIDIHDLSLEDVLVHLRRVVSNEQFTRIISDVHINLVGELYTQSYRRFEDGVEVRMGKARERKAALSRVHSIVEGDDRLSPYKDTLTRITQDYYQVRYLLLTGIPDADGNMKGNFGQDIRLTLPLLAENTRFSSASFTRATQRAVRLYSELFKVSLEMRGVGLTGEDLDSRLEVLCSQLQLYWYDRRIDGSVEKFSTAQFKSTMDNLDTTMYEVLSYATGKTVDDLHRLWIESRRQPQRKLEEMRRVGRVLAAQHQTRGELPAAGIAYAFLLSRGIDTKQKKGDAWRRIRFEALRQLVDFLTTISQDDLFKQKSYVSNHPAMLFLNQFFGDSIEMATPALLENPWQEVPVIYYQDPNDNWFLKDIKFDKSRVSFSRKARHEPAAQIGDFYSINMAIPDVVPKSTGEDLEEQPRSPIERIALARKIMLSFNEGLRTVYEEAGWTVELGATKDSLDNYILFSEGKPLKHLEGTGEGSIAERIIRLKQVYRLIDPEGYEYRFEFAVYPFENLREVDEHGNILIIGLVGKRADDERYSIDRMLERATNGRAGEPSDFEMDFPSGIYRKQQPLARSQLAR